MEYQGYHFYCHNRRLFGQYWYNEPPKAAIVLVHGMGEHSGRYSGSLIPELVDAGFAVFGYDLFGHGHSEGKRGCCPSFKAVLNSLEAVCMKKAEIFPELDLFLYGHSLGGNLVLNYAMNKEIHCKGLILSSPYLELAFDPPSWKLFLGKLCLYLYPKITLTSGIDPKFISRVAEEVEKYKDDPLVHNKVSPLYTFPILESGQWIMQNPDKLTIKTLLFHGTGDYITSHWASKAFAKQSPLIDLKLYKGGYHELHNDLQKEDLFKTVIDWLNEQLEAKQVNDLNTTQK